LNNQFSHTSNSDGSAGGFEEDFITLPLCKELVDEGGFREHVADRIRTFQSAGKWLIASFQNTTSVPERPFPTGPIAPGVAQNRVPDEEGIRSLDNQERIGCWRHANLIPLR
jgi:hypothetical protein